jgi:protein-S-isoprenylcysteine O-methyltransferase Ste14
MWLCKDLSSILDNGVAESLGPSAPGDPCSNRAMPDSFVARNARRLSTPVVLVLILACAALLLMHNLLGHGPVSIGLQVLAGLLWIWARLTFGLRSFHYAANPTAGGLVTTGPYRYLRHPIYASILLLVWAGVAANASPTGVALGLVATAMLVLRMLFEETLLRRTYPEYDDYARRTKRVLPFIL